MDRRHDERSKRRLDEFAALPGHLESLSKQRLRRGRAEANKRMRTDERDLGLEDADRFRFDGLWRITPRHHLRGAYYALDRDAERRIDRELEFGDIVIPVQGEVSANVDTSIAQLKRFKEDAREVAEGFECGILLDGFNDVKEGDVLEVFETREVERTELTATAAE